MTCDLRHSPRNVPTSPVMSDASVIANTGCRLHNNMSTPPTTILGRTFWNIIQFWVHKDCTCLFVASQAAAE
jgi:hypothetical protein